MNLNNDDLKNKDIEVIEDVEVINNNELYFTNKDDENLISINKEIKKYKRFKYLTLLIFSISLLIVTISYILLGIFIFNGWVLFIYLFLLPFIITSIYKMIKLKSFLRFPIVLISLFIYLSLSLHLNIYGLTSLIFLLIPIYFPLAIYINHKLKQRKIKKIFKENIIDDFLE